MTRALTTFAALLLAMLVGAACGYVHGWDDAARRLDPPVALCPNYDSAIVHPTPWQAQHGRKVRRVAVACDAGAVSYGYVR